MGALAAYSLKHREVIRVTDFEDLCDLLPWLLFREYAGEERPGLLSSEDLILERK